MCVRLHPVCNTDFTLLKVKNVTFRLPESSEISTMQITRLPGKSRKSLLVTDPLRSPPFFFFLTAVGGVKSQRRPSAPRSESTNCQSESLKFESGKKTINCHSTLFITEHSHIQTFSPLALSPTTAAVLLSCLMWSLSPHITISFPLFSPPSFYLLSSCFNPSVSFSSFFLLHLPPIFIFFLYLCFIFPSSALSFPFHPCAVYELTHFLFSSYSFMYQS